MSQPTKSNRNLLIGLVLGSIGMFGFGFALVPLYDVLCDALGINGKTQSTASSYEAVVIDKDRTVTIEFIAQVQSNMPWEFVPKVNRMQVHPGELTRTAFLAKNLSSNNLVGQAIPSVSPGQGAAYFNKTECFCFNQQPLAAMADAELPLIFYVDADLPESINTLTLSYTLYDITDKQTAAIEQGAAR
ncbi:MULTISPECIES: cytochrome c oxidase assembly protein [unclassified Shewanella]|uniref:cytochrome c oxidase assembly protein n=1 Tax=unclassified Shewanella TaxID=196818 RepID=UPI000C84C460|nr:MULTISPECIES: cytochrome c oxidase assembly protein [unclassified Shewanella]MDO6618396.1 cytochrome c oxidase assembly protein [Shewanella sp. 6_MG-2023]MDO6641979.1 cytochrome c oxidase assembly protein [Shewanella sp. 5_MG-2023]MDO6678102.1 cytochrome c oxidase assembly protein [Shewanella sp. 4_MG-2023]MDO6774470.1 cytochrome c oxidase assembly protein [Shewanella sp. 3_MG-2023]PMG41115.1 cytochrome c oxidase assembly protein [Shewanella sp. 10N.286.52.B9]